MKGITAENLAGAINGDWEDTANPTRFDVLHLPDGASEIRVITRRQ